MKLDWQIDAYGSGTMNVSSRSQPYPYFYVYGPGSESEYECVAMRRKVCEDIRDFLNGGQRPEWLDNMERVSETYAISADHTSIQATGPFVDRDPPNCLWFPDESDKAHNARARLMDGLFGIVAEAMQL